MDYVIFWKAKHTEIFNNRYAVCDVSHIRSWTDKDLTFLLLDGFFADDTGHFGWELFKILDKVLFEIVAVIEIPQTFGADFAFDFSIEQFFDFDFLDL